MRFLAPLILLVVCFAGCSDGPAEVATSTNDPRVADEAGLAAPTWAVGDAWTYTDSNGRPFTLVVTGADGADWTLDTDDAQLAFFDDQFGPISYMGAIRKSDLAGSQGSQRVVYFDFPLTDGKEWTTTWDGLTLRVVATQKGPEVFEMQAFDGEVVINEYRYSNSTGWFDWIRFNDGAGEEVFRMDLDSKTRGWTGEVIRVDADQFLSEAGTGPTADLQLIEVAAADEVWANVAVACTAGMGGLAVGPLENAISVAQPSLAQSDDGWAEIGPCPLDEQYFGPIGYTPSEGNWGWTVLGGSQDLTYTLLLWAVTFERITL